MTDNYYRCTWRMWYYLKRILTHMNSINFAIESSLCSLHCTSSNIKSWLVKTQHLNYLCKLNTQLRWWEWDYTGHNWQDSYCRIHSKDRSQLSRTMPKSGFNFLGLICLFQLQSAQSIPPEVKHSLIGKLMKIACCISKYKVCKPQE